MKIQDPSPTLCIKPQALHMIAYKGYPSGNPTSTRGTTSSGSHWSSHGQFHVVSALFMVIDDKGGEKWKKIWIILGWQKGRWDESAIMDMDQEEQYWGRSIFLDKRSTQVGGASSWICTYQRNEQRYELSLDDKGGDESAIMDMDQEEQYWGGSIFLDKRSTQVGGQVHELSCLHLICAYSCACLHLHKF